MRPLAENFIHGFNANHEFNLYVVNGYEAEDGYVLEFVDNGRGIPPERYVPFEAQCLIMMNLLPIVSGRATYIRAFTFLRERLFDRDCE